MKQAIATTNAPAAIGTYSQAIRVAETLYVSGQIALDPVSGELVADDFAAEVHQVFKNCQQILQASGGDLQHIVKMTIYITDMRHFATINSLMAHWFEPPYPARAVVAVLALPKNAQFEVDAIAHLPVDK